MVLQATRAFALAACLAVAAAPAVGWGDNLGSSALPLEGASFGMTISAWKALPAPESAGPTAVPACWNNREPVAVPGYRLSAEDKRTDLTTCAYVSRFGDVVLPHSVRLEAPFRADGLRFLFKGGRLAEVEFRTSIDAYSDMMALLTRRFGPPTGTDRGVVRTSLGKEMRVRLTWRVGVGRVVMVDPSANLSELGVVLALPPASGA